MKKALLILFFITCKIAISQSTAMINGKDTLNYTDPEGKKQSKWVILGKDAHKPEYKDDQKVEDTISCLHLDMRKLLPIFSADRSWMDSLK